MKKFLTVVVCLFAPLIASANSDDWTIASDGSSGSVIQYTILPKTITTIPRNDGAEQQVVVELTDTTSKAMMRRRLRVTGCLAGTGKVALADMNGNLIEGLPVFDWDKNGDRVFDQLAVRTCIAWIIKSQPEPDHAPKSKPAKPSGSVI